MHYLKILFLTLTLQFSFVGCGGNNGDNALDFGFNLEDLIVPCNDTNSSSPLVYPAPITAPSPLLVIQVEFANETVSDTSTAWSEKIFGTTSGTMNNYFNEVSYGNFQFIKATESDVTNTGAANDGVMHVTLLTNHPDSGFSDGIHSTLYSAMGIAALNMDVASYDTDANGHITPDELSVIFIIAGNEDSYSGDNASNGVWAHKSCLDAPPTVDGVTIMGCANEGNYAVFGEKHGDHTATIGIIAHELGHARFNLPDLYDVSQVGFGIGYFGLMGSGSWSYTGTNEAGSSPSHLTPWSKIFTGWTIPTDVNTSTDNSLYESSATNYNILKTPICNGKYLLMENRNNSGFDRGLEVLDGSYNGGLAIWQIDETIINNGLPSNSVNIGSNQGVRLIQAAAVTESAFSRGNEKNLFYKGNVDLLAKDNTLVHNISERNSFITLDILKK